MRIGHAFRPTLVVDACSVGAVCLAVGGCTGESQCSYVLGDEHLEVRCGVVDPARRGASIAVPIDLSSDDSDDSDDSSSEDNSEDSSDDSSDGSTGSGSSEDEGENSNSSKSNSNGGGGKERSAEDGSREEAGKENVLAGREEPNPVLLESIPAGTVGRLDVDKGAGCITPEATTKRFDIDLTDTPPKKGKRKNSSEDLSNAACSEKRPNATPTVTSGPKPIEPPTRRGGEPSTGPEAGGPDGAVARESAVPAGIPARGPAVLYCCKVLHDEGSTFLVISCPNIDYVSAVGNHAIIRGARRDKR